MRVHYHNITSIIAFKHYLVLSKNVPIIFDYEKLCLTCVKTTTYFCVAYFHDIHF